MIVFLKAENFCWAITAEIAEKKCQTALNNLIDKKKIPEDPLIDKIKEKINILLKKIATAQYEEIPQLLYSCMSGVDAMRWFVEQNETSSTTETK